MAELRPETRSRLALALDVGSAGEAVALMGRLRPFFGVAKVGLQLFTAEGPAVVAQVKGLGMEVFLDLKLHDIPNTVRGAARSAAATGARWVTVHASGGQAMLEAAVEGFGGTERTGGTEHRPVGQARALEGSLAPEEGWEPEGGPVGNGPELRPGVLAVTVLTSSHAPEGEVERLAELAERSGCAGLVCAAAELPRLRRQFPGLGMVVPGLRMEGDAPGDQTRIATPGAALEGGAALAVLGRSVTASADPEAAARRLWSSLAKIP